MRKVILLTVLTLGATAAQAENGLFYLGAGVTTSSLTENVGGYIHTDLKNNSWKAFAGVRPLKWLAVEADYVDLGGGDGAALGQVTYTTSHTDSSAWAAYVVGFLPVPLPVVDFYGKAGLARWKLNSSYTEYDPNYPQPLTSSTSHTGTDFAWGIGAQAHISIAGVRLEYESFDVNGSTANVASLSVFLNF